ncbi:hypothetical protein [Paenibacillus sp. FSL K6-1318]|uniref:hypothetical protein n=1 Tax=Paenibacillus sp. FSL K6-1318 TaxID=2975291 RepID=UPI0030EE9097
MNTAYAKKMQRVFEANGVSSDWVDLQNELDHKIDLLRIPNGDRSPDEFDEGEFIINMSCGNTTVLVHGGFEVEEETRHDVPEDYVQLIRNPYYLEAIEFINENSKNVVDFEYIN